MLNKKEHIFLCGFLTAFEPGHFFKQEVALKLQNRHQHRVSVC